MVDIMATIHTTCNLNIIRTITIGSFSYMVGHERGPEPPSPFIDSKLKCNPNNLRGSSMDLWVRPRERFFYPPLPP